uniref:Uncharacterized protein n=1 Tax=Cyanoderma ruficeps TaxID=181631 RepID=A0A8C3QY28_9PASS
MRRGEGEGRVQLSKRAEEWRMNPPSAPPARWVLSAVNSLKLFNFNRGGAALTGGRSPSRCLPGAGRERPGEGRGGGGGIMKLNRHSVLRLFALLLMSLAAWYLGYFVAASVPQSTVSMAALREVGKKPVLRAPAPKRQKCDHWSPCPPGNFAYRILSGGGKHKRAKICFEDEQFMNEFGSGINIAIVNYKTGKFSSMKFFEMWEGGKEKSSTELLLLFQH